MWNKIVAFVLEAKASFIPSMKLFFADAKDISHVLYEGYKDMLVAIFITHWQITLGVVIYWIICAVVLDLHERKKGGMLYPAFRPQMSLISGLVPPMMICWAISHAFMWIVDADYRKNHNQEKHQDSGFKGALAVAGVILYFGGAMFWVKNTPPEPETVTFKGDNGMVCHAYISHYGRKDKPETQKPYIAHSTCEEPTRTIASKRE